MKTCIVCKTEKDLSEFSPHKTCTGGYRTTCRVCRRASYASGGKEFVSRKIYGEKNKEKIKQKVKENYWKNPEKSRAITKKWCNENPERARTSRRKTRLKKKYRLTLDDFSRMVEIQNGLCACCGKKPSVEYPHMDISMGFYVDHDHSCCPGVNSCGKCVRSLLCQHCNHMLGHSKDSPSILEAGARYLRKHRSKHIEQTSLPL